MTSSYAVRYTLKRNVLSNTLTSADSRDTLSDLPNHPLVVGGCSVLLTDVLRTIRGPPPD